MVNDNVEKQLEEGITKSIREYVKGAFSPVAYYDERLDCIRVVTRDCSINEVRVNKFLTIAEDNFPSSPKVKYVGFTIKGVRHLMVTGQRDDGMHVKIVEILETILSNLPQELENFQARTMVEFAVNISRSILEGVGFEEKEVAVPWPMAA